MKPAKPIREKVRQMRNWRYSAVHLLCALILLLVVTPFVESSRNGEFIETVLVTLVLVSAGLAVGGQRHVLRIAIFLMVPTIAANWAHHLFPGVVTPVAHLACSIVFIGFVIIYVLRFIMRAPQVDAEVISAGISVYLMLGLLWAFGYLIAAEGSPSAFSIHTDPREPQEMSNFNALYFSYTSLSTLGFGDILPVSKVARMLSFMEAITGMLYVATLISRLVSWYSPVRNSNDPDTDS